MTLSIATDGFYGTGGGSSGPVELKPGPKIVQTKGTKPTIKSATAAKNRVPKIRR